MRAMTGEAPTGVEADGTGTEDDNIAASVVVCTCNRAAPLARCLAALGALREPPAGRLEILVVDNASSDGTAALVADFVARQPTRFRYLHEAKRGKSHALNSGIAQARGGIVLMTDDDCLVTPDWVCNMLEAFAADPGLGAVGGSVLLHDPADRAVALRTSEVAAELRDTGPLFSFVGGGNLAVRRDILARTGGFDPLLGPGSARNLGAEDIDYVYRMYREGVRIAYEPRARLSHAHGRRTDAEVAALHKTYIEGRGAFYAKHVLDGDWHALRMAYWELLGCLRDALRWPPSGSRTLAQARVVTQLLRGAAWRLGLELRQRWRARCESAPGSD